VTTSDDADLPQRWPNRVTAPRRSPVWRPPEDIADLFPEVSGNTINGLGERTQRSPSLIMWANPASIAHGAVQTHMTEEFLAHPELSTVLRVDDRHSPVPVSDQVVERAPEEWAEAVRTFALHDGPLTVELCGIAAIDRSWFFADRATDHTYVIVLGIAMDHQALSTAPAPTSAMEVHRQYNRGTSAARHLADWIRAQGHRAEGHGGPGAGPLLMVPAAIAAGLGELGKHGSLINPELGSSFRLSVVLTDLPLVADRPIDNGADEFCHGCRVCAEACPPAAISHTEQLVRGRTRWYVDVDRCLPYFAASHGCGICIAVCPWSTPGEGWRISTAVLDRRRRRNSARATADTSSAGDQQHP